MTLLWVNVDAHYLGQSLVDTPGQKWTGADVLGQHSDWAVTFLQQVSTKISPNLLQLIRAYYNIDVVCDTFWF